MGSEQKCVYPHPSGETCLALSYIRLVDGTPDSPCQNCALSPLEAISPKIPNIYLFASQLAQELELRGTERHPVDTEKIQQELREMISLGHLRELSIDDSIIRYLFLAKRLTPDEVCTVLPDIEKERIQAVHVGRNTGFRPLSQENILDLIRRKSKGQKASECAFVLKIPNGQAALLYQFLGEYKSPQKDRSNKVKLGRPPGKERKQHSQENRNHSSEEGRGVTLTQALDMNLDQMWCLRIRLILALSEGYARNVYYPSPTAIALFADFEQIYGPMSRDETVKIQQLATQNAFPNSRSNAHGVTLFQLYQTFSEKPNHSDAHDQE